MAANDYSNDYDHTAESEYALGLVQGSPEWLQYRTGRVSASRMADITAKIRSGAPSASRATYMGELIVERLTGVPQSSYVNAAMQWGTEQEPAARKAYRQRTLNLVEQVGIVIHQRIANAIASPDGLIEDRGLVEIKCPAVSYHHLEALLGADIPNRYALQMQWQLACSGRDWVDYVSFDPRLPPSMQLYIRRIGRDEATIRELEEEVVAFLEEIDRRISDLRNRFEEAA